MNAGGQMTSDVEKLKSGRPRIPHVISQHRPSILQPPLPFGTASLSAFFSGSGSGSDSEFSRDTAATPFCLHLSHTFFFYLNVQETSTIRTYRRAALLVHAAPSCRDDA